MPSTNLRRRRKSDSKERLIVAAGELFDEYGYDDTTLEGIADHAGLHVQTLYRHFAGKNELAFALLFDNLRQFEAYFQRREKDALHAWRDWVELNAQAAMKRPATATDAAASVRLSPKWAEYWHRYETVLAAGIAADMDVDPAQDLRPMLMACMLVGANKHTSADLEAAGDGKRFVASLLRVVDTVIDEFSPVLQR